MQARYGREGKRVSKSSKSPLSLSCSLNFHKTLQSTRHGSVMAVLGRMGEEEEEEDTGHNRSFIRFNLQPMGRSELVTVNGERVRKKNKKKLYAVGAVYVAEGTSQNELHYSNKKIKLTRIGKTNVSLSLMNIFIVTCLCCLLSGKNVTQSFTVCKRNPSRLSLMFYSKGPFWMKDLYRLQAETGLMCKLD